MKCKSSSQGVFCTLWSAVVLPVPTAEGFSTSTRMCSLNPSSGTATSSRRKRHVADPKQRNPKSTDERRPNSDVGYNIISFIHGDATFGFKRHAYQDARAHSPPGKPPEDDRSSSTGDLINLSPATALRWQTRNDDTIAHPADVD
jgi:hypothetical protein